MTAFPSTTHLAAALRDLPSCLPYTRLFGAHFNSHFVGEDEASRLRRPERLGRELERR